MVLAVALVGLVCLVVITSLSALIFAGPMEAFLPIGLAAGMIGTIVVNLAIAVRPRTGAIVALPASAGSVILAIVMAEMSVTLSDAPDEVMAATAALALAAAALVTGLLFLVAGLFRLGELARYVPYPVFAGFLGGVGLLLVIGALDLAAQPAGGSVTDVRAAVYWVPALAMGAFLFAANRFWSVGAVLPLAVLGALTAFHIGLVVLGIDIEAASRAGLLLVTPDTSSAPAVFPLFGLARHADVSVVVGHWPSMAVLALLALVSGILGASGSN